MEGLFFAVKPLWWNGEIPMASLIIASTFAMIYVVIRFLRSMKPLLWGNYPDFIFIGEQDSEFAGKTLENLKQYLTHIHNPARVTSHTVQEIKRYISDPELLSILDTLEKAEYSGNMLSTQECRSINTFLSEMISRDMYQKSEK